jgi:DNA repair photolyase
VKTNIARQLRRELGRPSWTGSPIAFSGNTDCYQPVEAHYKLTRECLKVCRDYRNPVGIITKSTLIRRDIPLLIELNARVRSRGLGACRVWVSIPFADDRAAKAIEVNAPPPSKRFDVLRDLSAAGLHTGVIFAPVIPGLNEHAIPEVLARARDAGASMASFILLRLPREVRPVFEARVREAMPLRAEKVMRALNECRGGQATDSVFGSRMRGTGPRWDAIASLFHHHHRRLGFEETPALPEVTTPRVARRPKRQLELFGEE